MISELRKYILSEIKRRKKKKKKRPVWNVWPTYGFMGYNTFYNDNSDSSGGGEGIAETLAEETIINKYDKLFPLAGTTLNGLEVKDSIPNTSSISASLDNYKVLRGVRSIPISEFNASPHDLFYATSDFDRVDNLAKSIAENKWISPLIVVVDNEGVYVLEGAHRLGALYQLDIKEFPALVVLDLDALDGEILTESNSPSKHPIYGLSIEDIINFIDKGNYYDIYPNYSEDYNENADYMFKSKEHLMDEIEQMFYIFDNLPDPIPIYRTIKVDSVNDINLDNLGDSWSYNKKSALNFAKNHNWGNVLLSGKVKKDFVDWKQTIKSYLLFTMGQYGNESEDEISLPYADEDVIQDLKIIELNKKNITEDKKGIKKNYKTLYRGTNLEIDDELIGKEIIFASEEEHFARNYGNNLYELEVDLGDVFDSTQRKYVEEAYKHGFKFVDDWLDRDEDEDNVEYDWENEEYPTIESYLNSPYSETNSFNVIESTPNLIDWILKKYDSILITEESVVNYMFKPDGIQNVKKIK